MHFRQREARPMVAMLVAFALGPLTGCSSSDGDAGTGGGGGTGHASTVGGQSSPGGSAGGASGGAAGGGMASGGSVVGSTASGGSNPAGGSVEAGSSSRSSLSIGGTMVGGAQGGTSASGTTNGGTGGTSSGAGGASASTAGGTTSVAGSLSKGGSGGNGTSLGGQTGGTSSGGVTSSGGKGTGGTTSTGGSTGSLPSVTIYIAGDSTVSNYTDTSAKNDQAGWGQMLHEIFSNKVTVDNRAAGGRTAYWFYLEGAAGKILSAIKPGDYFFIQFGTNDQNETATFTVDGKTYPRYAEAGTAFKTQLKTYYLDPTKAKKAIPVLVTPPPRNSAYCNGGNGLSAYATAMIELGAAENVAVLDNNGKTLNYLKAICPKPTNASAETFFLGKSDGSIDGTHFQENGARKMAEFLGEEIKRLNLGLAAYLL
jgi:lysophospholipase L1-like esterase